MEPDRSTSNRFVGMMALVCVTLSFDCVLAHYSWATKLHGSWMRLIFIYERWIMHVIQICVYIYLIKTEAYGKYQQQQQQIKMVDSAFWFLSVFYSSFRFGVSFGGDLTIKQKKSMMLSSRWMALSDSSATYHFSTSKKILPGANSTLTTEIRPGNSVVISKSGQKSELSLDRSNKLFRCLIKTSDKMRNAIVPVPLQDVAKGLRWKSLQEVWIHSDEKKWWAKNSVAKTQSFNSHILPQSHYWREKSFGFQENLNFLFALISFTHLSLQHTLLSYFYLMIKLKSNGEFATQYERRTHTQEVDRIFHMLCI